MSSDTKRPPKKPSIHELSFEERKAHCERVKKRWPDRVPVIVNYNRSGTKDDLPDIPEKYLIPIDSTGGHLMQSIREQLKLSPEFGLFFMIRGTNSQHWDILVPNALMLQIAKEYTQPDGFVYVMYSKENIFG